MKARWIEAQALATAVDTIDDWVRSMRVMLQLRHSTPCETLTSHSKSTGSYSLARRADQATRAFIVRLTYNASTSNIISCLQTWSLYFDGGYISRLITANTTVWYRAI